MINLFRLLQRGVQIGARPDYDGLRATSKPRSSDFPEP
jgi:hypothetical protein